MTDIERVRRQIEALYGAVKPSVAMPLAACGRSPIRPFAPSLAGSKTPFLKHPAGLLGEQDEQAHGISIKDFRGGAS